MTGKKTKTNKPLTSPIGQSSLRIKLNMIIWTLEHDSHTKHRKGGGLLSLTTVKTFLQP
jgi:hypothetical protein